MIFGIGTDLVSVSRITRNWERFGNAFARRILGEKEYAAYERLKDNGKQQVYFLAKHFAAKEAAVKAFGTGFSRGIHYHDVCVTHTKEGKPCLEIAQKVFKILRYPKELQAHLSLSDESEWVIAFVVLETIP